MSPLWQFQCPAGMQEILFSHKKIGQWAPVFPTQQYSVVKCYSLKQNNVIPCNKMLFLQQFSGIPPFKKLLSPVLHSTTTLQCNPQLAFYRVLYVRFYLEHFQNLNL